MDTGRREGAREGIWELLNVEDLLAFCKLYSTPAEANGSDLNIINMSNPRLCSSFKMILGKTSHR